MAVALEVELEGVEGVELAVVDVVADVVVIFVVCGRQRL